MSEVVVRYHQEPEGWWADTDLLPQFSAAGSSYDQVFRRVREALSEILDHLDESDLREVILVEPNSVGISFVTATSDLLSRDALYTAASPVVRKRQFQLIRPSLPQPITSCSGEIAWSA